MSLHAAQWSSGLLYSNIAGRVWKRHPPPLPQHRRPVTITIQETIAKIHDIIMAERQVLHCHNIPRLDLKGHHKRYISHRRPVTITIQETIAKIHDIIMAERQVLHCHNIPRLDLKGHHKRYISHRRPVTITIQETIAKIHDIIMAESITLPQHTKAGSQRTSQTFCSSGLLWW